MIDFPNTYKEAKALPDGAYAINNKQVILIKKDNCLYAINHGNRNLDHRNERFILKLYDRDMWSILSNYWYCTGWIIKSDTKYQQLKSTNFYMYAEDDHISKWLVDLVDTYNYSLKHEQPTQIGVELELESDSYFKERKQLEESSHLIRDVGSDCSVYNGCEIRFNHPNAKDWKFKDIKQVLDKAKSYALKTDKGTAGMHIHISRPDILKAIEAFRNNITVIQEILYPINARKQYMYDGSRVAYGVNGNIYHDQFNSFGTLEIRAWNATTNPYIFNARVKFAEFFTRYLIQTQEPITFDNFINWMTPANKKVYKYLLTHENPHEFGGDWQAINAKL